MVVTSVFILALVDLAFVFLFRWYIHELWRLHSEIAVLKAQLWAEVQNR